jgi:hypothetical protein
LPKIENEAQLWINLDLMCKVFSINGNLFSKILVNSTNNNENLNINGNGNGIKTQTNSSRSNSIDSNSMNSSYKPIINENGNHQDSFSLDNTLNANKCKLPKPLTKF